MESNDVRPLFFPATTRRASEVIYDQIYQKIVSGELRPGERLPSERELAEQFQRSRPSVREALRMLQQDGLLEITVGSAGGAMIRAISLQTVEEPLRRLVDVGAINPDELVEYRYINDLGCVRLAAVHHTDADARALEATLQNAEASLSEPRSFQRYDALFHHALATASHNALVLLINDAIVGLNTKLLLDSIQDFTPAQHEELNRSNFETHRAILDAVLDRDPEGACRCVEASLRLFRKYVH